MRNLPKIGQIITVNYKDWTKGGRAVSKSRTGKVVQVMPITHLPMSNMFNVLVRRWGLFDSWHSIDHNSNTIS